MLTDTLKNNKALHVFTNSILCANTRRVQRGNRVEGYRQGLLVQTGLLVKGRGNRVSFGPGSILRKCRIVVLGEGNTVSIGRAASLNGCLLWISGQNCAIEIGDENVMMRTEFGAEHANSRITTAYKARIGGFVQLGLGQNNISQSFLYAGEGAGITLGEDSQISDGAMLRTSDSHPIYDEEGARINHAAAIHIGSHAWVGSHASLLKGAGVGDGSIVGHRALVTKDFSAQGNAVLAGAPAKVVRTGVRWADSLAPDEGAGG